MLDSTIPKIASVMAHISAAGAVHLGLTHTLGLLNHEVRVKQSRFVLIGVGWCEKKLKLKQSQCKFYADSRV